MVVQTDTDKSLMARTNGSQRGRRWKRPVVVAMATASAMFGLMGATASPSWGSRAVSVLSVHASPSSLGASGGTVTVTGKVAGAISCQLKLLSSQGFPVVYSHNPTTSCRHGAYSARVTVGANTAPARRTVALALVARNGSFASRGRFYITLAATPKPEVLSVRALPGYLWDRGGQVTVVGRVEHAKSCQLRLLSRQSFQVVYSHDPTDACRDGTYTAHVTIGPNQTPVQRSVAFELVARNGASVFSGRFYVQLAPHVVRTVTVSPTTTAPPAATTTIPPATTTTLTPAATTTLPPAATTTTVPPAEVTTISVSLSLSPSAANPSTSLTGDYTATANATCGYSDGSSGPCDLPAGTITWEALGGDAGGNFMYPSTTFSGCTSQVAGTSDTSQCTINWNTYGDQWLSATYTSSPSSQLGSQLVVPQTLPVQIAAPVDLAAGNSYDTYDNTGPQGIGDCMMAAAADWIETTFETAPSSQGVVSDFWAAENEFNGGADVGLTSSQLFTYWQSNAIGGYMLTGVDPISASDVESELSSHYVLFATVNLPSGYPLGDGQGGGHGWILVGYSSFGPMVVSWGQEVQISWADFDAWTTGVWALGASQG